MPLHVITAEITIFPLNDLKFNDQINLPTIFFSLSSLGAPVIEIGPLP